MPFPPPSPRLSVVFSFRNEEAVLAELIRRTRAACAAAASAGLIGAHEFIFINDASTDGSLRLLRDNAQGRTDIRIVTMSRRFGVSAGIMAGFARAQGDVVIYMDADLQDPPELIPDLLRTWKEQGVDIVHTVRQRRLGESPFKLFLTRIGYAVLNKLSSVDLPREAGDFKLLSRRAVDHVLMLKEPRPFIRGMVCWIGFRHAFLPYERAARYAGTTKMPVLGRTVLGNFINSALVFSSGAPLLLAPAIGALCVLAGMFGLVAKGNTTHALILLVGGSQLIGLGILGIYVNTIVEQGKQRPLYIIESTEGFPSS